MMEWKLPSGWCIVKDKQEQLVAFSKIIQLLMFLDFSQVLRGSVLPSTIPLNIKLLLIRLEVKVHFIHRDTIYSTTHAYHAGCKAWNYLAKESMRLHICRILTTAPLTHSNDACHPSVCLLVIWRWHTVACRMPSLILARVWCLRIGRERAIILKVHLSCLEQNGLYC